MAKLDPTTSSGNQIIPTQPEPEEPNTESVRNVVINGQPTPLDKEKQSWKQWVISKLGLDTKAGTESRSPFQSLKQKASEYWQKLKNSSLFNRSVRTVQPNEVTSIKPKPLPRTTSVQSPSVENPNDIDSVSNTSGDVVTPQFYQSTLQSQKAFSGYVKQSLSNDNASTLKQILKRVKAGKKQKANALSQHPKRIQTSRARLQKRITSLLTQQTSKPDADSQHKDKIAIADEALRLTVLKSDLLQKIPLGEMAKPGADLNIPLQLPPSPFPDSEDGLTFQQQQIIQALSGMQSLLNAAQLVLDVQPETVSRSDIENLFTSIPGAKEKAQFLNRKNNIDSHSFRFDLMRKITTKLRGLEQYYDSSFSELLDKEVAGHPFRNQSDLDKIPKDFQYTQKTFQELQRHLQSIGEAFSTVSDDFGIKPEFR